MKIGVAARVCGIDVGRAKASFPRLEAPAWRRLLLVPKAPTVGTVGLSGILLENKVKIPDKPE